MVMKLYWSFEHSFRLTETYNRSSKSIFFLKESGKRPGTEKGRKGLFSKNVPQFIVIDHLLHDSSQSCGRVRVLRREQ